MIHLTFALTALIIMIALIYMQKNHYSFLSQKNDHEKMNEIQTELNAKLKEFDEYKRKVDHLVLKAGFNL
jgi:cell division protein FtsL